MPQAMLIIFVPPQNCCVCFALNSYITTTKGVNWIENIHASTKHIPTYNISYKVLLGIAHLLSYLQMYFVTIVNEISWVPMLSSDGRYTGIWPNIS